MHTYKIQYTITAELLSYGADSDKSGNYLRPESNGGLEPCGILTIRNNKTIRLKSRNRLEEFKTKYIPRVLKTCLDFNFRNSQITLDSIVEINPPEEINFSI